MNFILDTLIHQLTQQQKSLDTTFEVSPEEALKMLETGLPVLLSNGQVLQKVGTTYTCGTLDTLRQLTIPLGHETMESDDLFSLFAVLVLRGARVEPVEGTSARYIEGSVTEQ